MAQGCTLSPTSGTKGRRGPRQRSPHLPGPKTPPVGSGVVVVGVGTHPDSFSGNDATHSSPREYLLRPAHHQHEGACPFVLPYAAVKLGLGDPKTSIFVLSRMRGNITGTRDREGDLMRPPESSRKCRADVPGHLSRTPNVCTACSTGSSPASRASLGTEPSNSSTSTPMSGRCCVATTAVVAVTHRGWGLRSLFPASAMGLMQAPLGRLAESLTNYKTLKAIKYPLGKINKISVDQQKMFLSRGIQSINIG